ncbi:MAG: 16S rRNA (cytidine(1402)-2'-O)-methyltransferase [Bryobacteraceae bacterium]
MLGTLYVVATPIGNLEDITYRAVDTLRRVDLIACEDTRHSRRLLDHFGIKTPVRSYHEHNEHRQSRELLDVLREGRSIALISDAGTPLVSDPGYRLTAAAARAGVTVVPIPGASAVMAALTASGLPSDSFRYCGFLPSKAAARRALLESLRKEPATVIAFEAPHRIMETLRDMSGILGDRPIALAREMTKMHEEFLRGSASEVASRLSARPDVRGEITLVIGSGERKPAVRSELEIVAAVEELERSGVPRMEAIKECARRLGLPKREVYRIAGQGRGARIGPARLSG